MTASGMVDDGTEVQLWKCAVKGAVTKVEVLSHLPLISSFGSSGDLHSSGMWGGRV